MCVYDKYSYTVEGKISTAFIGEGHGFVEPSDVFSDVVCRGP